MTDTEIEKLTIKEMGELVDRIHKVMFTRTLKLWRDANPDTPANVSEFTRFRDAMADLGR